MSAIDHARVEEAVSSNFEKKSKKEYFFFGDFLAHKEKKGGKAMGEEKACYLENITSKDLETINKTTLKLPRETVFSSPSCIGDL